MCGGLHVNVVDVVDVVSDSSVPMAQPTFFQKMAIVFQIKFLNFWEYLTR
jgi:hypothetical protein